MKRKVLIVEDEPVVALDLHEEVEQLGCEVVGVAESAEHAMAIAEIYRPDLALMDINIIGCMDGIQTAQLLRSTYKIPSVFLTSYTDDATLQRAVQDLTYGYLTKPYRSQQLKAALTVAIRLIETDEAAQGDQCEILAAVSAMREGLMTISLEGEVQFMNAAAEKVTGVPPRDARGKQLKEVLMLADDFQLGPGGALPHFLHANRSPHGDRSGTMGIAMAGFGKPLEGPNRNPLPVDVSFAPMIDNAGQLTGYAVTLRDEQPRGIFTSR